MAIHFPVTAEARGFYSTMDGVRKSVRSTMRDVQESGKSIEDVFEGIKRAATMSFAGFSAASFINQVKQVRGEFQQLEIAFKTMLGSEQKANALMDTYINSMISAYQNNYNDDLGIQLKGMLEDTLEIMKQDGISKIKSDKAFDSHCYRDDLNWIDTKNNVVTGAQEFYDATGIQFYVMFVKTRTIAKATNHSAGVFKVLIIAAAVVIVVCILFSWWKKRTAQKNKEQEDLERTLKTPLETFGSTPMDDLKAKYDNQDNNQS